MKYIIDEEELRELNRLAGYLDRPQLEEILIILYNIEFLHAVETVAEGIVEGLVGGSIVTHRKLFVGGDSFDTITDKLKNKLINSYGKPIKIYVGEKWNMKMLYFT